MGIQSSVFRSATERDGYVKLSRAWGDRFRIYHDLPFLNVFTVDGLIDISDYEFRPIVLDPDEVDRLKGARVGFTLCDEEDKPLVCVDLDHQNEGYSSGMSYHPHYPPLTEWAERMPALKLKVAFGSLFPYFVVSAGHFDDIDPELEFTIVDGVIGHLMATKATRERLATGFDPNECGYTQEQFGELDPVTQQELLEDWAVGVECESEFEHNPIVRRHWQLGREVGLMGHASRTVRIPPIPTDTSRDEAQQLIQSSTVYGAEVTFHTSDLGDVTRAVVIPQFDPIGCSCVSLPEEIACIQALSYIKRARETNGEGMST